MYVVCACARVRACAARCALGAREPRGGACCGRAVIFAERSNAHDLTPHSPALLAPPPAHLFTCLRNTCCPRRSGSLQAAATSCLDADSDAKDGDCDLFHHRHSLCHPRRSLPRRQQRGTLRTARAFSASRAYHCARRSAHFLWTHLPATLTQTGPVRLFPSPPPGCRGRGAVRQRRCVLGRQRHDYAVHGHAQG